MAESRTPASASSRSTLDSEDPTGEASGWVEPLTHCPHLSELPTSCSHLPAFDSLCSRCHDPRENWACLICQETLCGRYINAHMLGHFKATNHSIAISFRDLSVWCFKCESYLDAQVIPQLRPAFELLYIMKFREPPPVRMPSTHSGPQVLELFGYNNTSS